MPQDPEVEAFLDQLDHPLIAEIRAVRKIVLGVDKRITESIKWASRRSPLMEISRPSHRGPKRPFNCSFNRAP